MRKGTDHTNFIRYLKNEQFIEWKLFPTDELDAYWSDFLQQHPNEQTCFELAEKHFRQIRLSSPQLRREKKQEAMKRLEQSLRVYNRMRNLRRFTYAVAACVVSLILLTLYIQKGKDATGEDFFSNGNFIVGNELESADILLVTGDQTTTFQGNVDIEIEENKTARVRSEQAAEAEISIEQHATNKLIVPYGKRSEILLSDGTRAWLNSGSTLEFPSAFSGKRREVFLSGEMYIEVAPMKDKSFVVHTPGYNVKVYGTKFNVSAYSGTPSNVVLVEGRVSLQTAEREELFLSPKEQAVFSETTGTFDTREVDIRSFISWKEGYLTFADTPVTDALKQIERYYNLSFNLDNNVSFKGLTCTGKIILSDNLDNVMTALSLISGTEYKRENNRIYIYKK
jgi:transmembrane sensor